MAQTIDIPADPSRPDKRWRPRDYQMPFWRDFENDKKRAICIWARRHGKDEAFLHAMVVAAHQRVGTYWYMLPEASQARKAIWEAIDEDRGQRRIDMAIPMELRERTRDSDMFIKLKVGSTIQIVGSDNYNSLVGSPPVGVVHSEFALADPSAHGYLSPILERNGGWAFFNTTPRGPNHAQRMYDMAMREDGWHASLVTARDSGLYDEIALARIKREYIELYGRVLGDAMYHQEYMCSFEAAILGAVYGDEIHTAREDGRITDVPYDSAHAVETWWDLGYRDPCAIWFVQRLPGGKLHAIDYYENNLAGLDHYAKVLSERGYTYSRHLVPHDAAKGEIGTGATLVDQAQGFGLRLEKQPQAPLVTGINKTRPIIRRMWFDSKKCERGLDALTNYRYEWNEARNTLSPTPLHDWASHGADALRTGAMAREPMVGGGRRVKRRMQLI